MNTKEQKRLNEAELEQVTGGIRIHLQDLSQYEEIPPERKDQPMHSFIFIPG